MGMFDKDKIFGVARLDETVQHGEHFVIWGAGIRPVRLPLDETKADKADTEVAFLVISTYANGMDDELNAPQVVQTIATAIIRNAALAEVGDFPAIASTAIVKARSDAWNNAYVLNWHGPYKGTVPTLPDPPDGNEDTHIGAMADGRQYPIGK